MGDENKVNAYVHPQLQQNHGKKVFLKSPKDVLKRGRRLFGRCVTVVLNKDYGTEAAYDNQRVLFPLVPSMPQPMGHQEDGQDYGIFVHVEKERTKINEHVMDDSKLLDVSQQDLQQGKKLRASQNSSAAANYCKLFNILGFFILLLILMEHEHLPSK